MRTNMKTTDIDKKKQDEKKPRGDLRREKRYIWKRIILDKI